MNTFWLGRGVNTFGLGLPYPSVEETGGSAGGAGGRRFGRTLTLPIKRKKKDEDDLPLVAKTTVDHTADFESFLQEADKLDAKQRQEIRARAREDAQVKQKILQALEAEFAEKQRQQLLRMEEEEFMILMMLADE